MLGLLFYSVGAFMLAGILTLFTTMFRPIQDKGESRPWRAFIVWLAVCVGGPYLFIEGMTKVQGKHMEHAIKEAYNSADIDGPLQYYKVEWVSGGKAKAIAVGLEKQSWGGTDHPLMSINLVKKGDQWECDSYRLVYSDRLNKDGINFPPYW